VTLPSFCDFWSNAPGVPDCENDAGDPELLRRELPVAERPEARDLRRPCPDADVGFCVSGGGAEGDHVVPAKSASSYMKFSTRVEPASDVTHLGLVFRCCP
jgi:hypothetical protein